jgi:hypothetical protein
MKDDAAPDPTCDIEETDMTPPATSVLGIGGAVEVKVAVATTLLVNGP